MSFVGEKWQDLPVLGKTRNSVPVPKVVLLVPIGQRQSGAGTDQSGIGTLSPVKDWYRYPFTSKGVVPVPELPATLFLHPCIVKSHIRTPIV